MKLKKLLVPLGWGECGAENKRKTTVNSLGSKEKSFKFSLKRTKLWGSISAPSLFLFFNIRLVLRSQEQRVNLFPMLHKQEKKDKLSHLI